MNILDFYLCANHAKRPQKQFHFIKNDAEEKCILSVAFCLCISGLLSSLTKRIYLEEAENKTRNGFDLFLWSAAHHIQAFVAADDISTLVICSFYAFDSFNVLLYFFVGLSLFVHISMCNKMDVRTKVNYDDDVCISEDIILIFFSIWRHHYHNNKLNIRYSLNGQMNWMKSCSN